MRRKHPFTIVSILLIMILLAGDVLSFAETASVQTSEQQIVEHGGRKYFDHDGKEITGVTVGNGATVSLSKTISPTEDENIFDITLNIETTMEMVESTTTVVTSTTDTAVVLDIDMSGTMYRFKLDNKRRVDVAKEKATLFVEEYAASAEDTDAKRMVAIACFDTDAKIVQQWIDVNPNNNPNGLSTVKSAINNMSVVDNGSTSSDYVCTNFDGGIILSKNLLKQNTIDDIETKHCWSIIISDGAPTVTVAGDSDTVGTIKSTFWTGQGYQNARAGGGWTHPEEVRNTITYLRALAAESNVYMVGVGSGERGDMDFLLFNDAVYGTTNGTRPSGIKNNAAAFDGIIPTITLNMTTGQWLTALVNDSQVKGTYISVADSETLSGAFDLIIESIKSKSKIEKTEISSSAWVVTDPVGTELSDYVTFMGFYGDPEGEYTAETYLTKEEHGNAAVVTDDVIKWDLKKSDAVINGDIYSYTMKYRVRLTNEEAGFIEIADNEPGYDTNGTTTFHYQIVQDDTFSDMFEVQFPIPSVRGYLGELSFEKVDEEGNALLGAEFKLLHADDCCSIAVNSIIPIVEGSTYRFSNIPSAHKYVLRETTLPTGYENKYGDHFVEVSWDKVYFDGVQIDSGNVLKIENEKIRTTVEIQAVKKIKASDINLANGEPVFIFKLVNQESGRTYYRQVVFTEEMISGSIDEEGYISTKTIFEKLPEGEYVLTEEDASRYRTEDITDIINGEKIENGVAFSLKSGEDASATFINNKYEQQFFSHSDIVINHFH